MNLLFKILYLASFITPALAPFLYRSKRPSMIDFYRNMATRPVFRIAFMKMLALYLTGFHFFYLTVYNRPMVLIPSTVILMLIFSTRLCDKLLFGLHHKRIFITVICLGLLIMPVAQLLPLGFTLVALGVASVFYPSRLLDDMTVFTCGTDDEIVNRYFSWPEWGRRKNTKFEAIEDAEVIEYIDD